MDFRLLNGQKKQDVILVSGKFSLFFSKIILKHFIDNNTLYTVVNVNGTWPKYCNHSIILIINIVTFILSM